MIKTRDLVKAYPSGSSAINALAGVSIEIGAGEFVAIMGPSGSGKTTLMNIIGCLDRPSSGTYELDGVAISELKDDELAAIRSRKIGFVFQSYNLLRRQTAVEQVELPLIYTSAGERRRERARETLIAVGLADRLDHRPTELSGGEQQRVGIARALVKDPALILADEPTGNLDSRSSEEILTLFREFNQERGITVVLVTHEPDVALWTRRVITMRDGLIQSDRPTAALPTNGTSTP